VFSLLLRGDKANGFHRGMNFIRPVKDIEAMEIEVLILYYEHRVAGKQSLCPVFAHLFTFMLRSSHIPDKRKRGIIITFHKGGKKRKDDPNCYRAITLSSCVLKLFEIII